jgi:hypothetical protein
MPKSDAYFSDVEAPYLLYGAHVDYHPRAVLHISTASPLKDLPINRANVDYQEQEGGSDLCRVDACQV